ncbi:hypothetical protein SAMN04487819_1167 [Actinopolyspora alba]|uniref:Uncharacterized protein n=1 Tax=Actinopolyspora alba TaxID=673379 RepID=A0A1I2BBQ1_9ACTN|nr:hypothetical protein SAMN04487819_1167 [Actinopolyspora alba]
MSGYEILRFLWSESYSSQPVEGTRTFVDVSLLDYVDTSSDERRLMDDVRNSVSEAEYLDRTAEQGMVYGIQGHDLNHHMWMSLDHRQEMLKLRLEDPLASYGAPQGCFSDYEPYEWWIRALQEFLALQPEAYVSFGVFSVSIRRDRFS